MEVATTDYHTAGEPFRIVTAGAPAIPGSTVRERRAFAQRDAEVDAVRRLLCHEPRGHADMYGCFPVPPDDAGADLGVLFWHKDGYSTAARETDDALAARATVVVESRASALREAGDVIGAIEAGALRAGELVTLRELVAGVELPPGPRLFKSTGMAWEDAVVAAAVYERG
jgi:proline racemase